MSKPEWPGPDRSKMARELAESIWRPRDASDADVHPESLRGKALALMDATDAACRQIKSTRRGRLLWNVAQLWARLRERAG